MTWSLILGITRNLQVEAQGGIRPKTDCVDMTVTTIQKVIASAVIAQETA